MTKTLWWLPSFGFFFFLGLQFNLFLGVQGLFGDPAVPRHLATGNYIMRTGHIPTENPFGFIQPPLPWIDYEWGFESLVAFLHDIGGLALEAAYQNALFAAIFLCVHRTLLKAGISFPVTLLCTCFAFVTLHLHYSLRPTLFTYLFLTIVVEVWRFRPTPNRWDFIFLPLIFTAWVNLHAGWMAGLVFMGLSWMGRWLDRARRRVQAKDAPLLPWMKLGILCGLATLINPISFHLAPHMVEVLGYKSAVLWDEYNIPNFAQPAPLAVIILIVLAIFLYSRLLRTAPLWTLEIALPILLFIYYSLKCQRHAMILVIFALVPLARDLEVLFMSGIRKQQFLPNLIHRLDEIQAQQRQAGADGWMSFLAMILVPGIWLTTAGSQSLDPTSEALKPELVSYLHKHASEMKAPLTTTANGGPLMLLLWPDLKISFDDRGDLYQDKRVFEFVNLYNAGPKWRKKMAEAGYDSAIIEPGSSLADALENSPDWRKGYENKTVVVFIKNQPTRSLLSPPPSGQNLVPAK